MPRLQVHTPRRFEQAFAAVREELDVPTAFPDEVLAEAAAARPADVARLDARSIPLIAIDPPGATDLDQAYHAETDGERFIVHYAIADVGAFVVPGGAVDMEARKRGATLYSPDRRTPVHPPVLSEDRASLLPDGDRPALLWTITLDSDTNPIDWNLQRATVRVAEAISYAQAQERIDQGDDGSLGLLATIGRGRQEREADRGGVSLNLPPQEVVEHDGSYQLEYGTSLPVEGWNAQISLLTGMVAADVMLDAGDGILRTLPPPDQDEIVRLRRVAAALGLVWPPSASYAEFVRNLRPISPETNAFLIQCTRVFRGAGYLGFTERPDGIAKPGGVVEHGAIAAPYAHVTAPLRRLVDRFGNEIVLAVLADREPPAWAVEALDELPSLMGRARSRESALERAMIDITEAIILESSVGQRFRGVVVDRDDRKDEVTVQIADPAVVADVADPGVGLAETVVLELTEVDVNARRVGFVITGD